MKRYFRWFGILILALATIGPAVAASPGSGQRRKRVHRTVVVVHKGFPLKRPLRKVVVRPPRVMVRVAPVRFLPHVVWGGVIVAAVPARDILIWEDGETLNREEGWTEFTLNCDNTGTKLWLEVAAGRAQFDWAEVVFSDGEAQVVDMSEWTRGPGHYLLLDFANGRKVDHVRVVARAESSETRLVLKMEK